MTTKNNRGFSKGDGNINRAGRPKGTGRPISRLRSTLNKLKRLEAESIEVIEKALHGKTGDEISKEQSDMAKWIITSIASLTRTAITEESHTSNLKEKEEERNNSVEEQKATGTEGKARFVTYVLPDEDDYEE